ncbi:MAG TPA: 4Fe-4S binding protein [Bryobacteraceae bacterium]|nr:4Fe-4S binding protein [Bryobacteraceae bacterium]
MESEILYRKLQQHLDRMPVGFPASPSAVEIRILRQLFTPEEAEIALELSAFPEPAAVIHKRLPGMALDGLTRLLEQMSAKGLILRLPSGKEFLYSKLIFAIGMYERQVHRLTAGLERDSRQYMQEAFGQAFHSKKTTQMRIVPVNQSIPVERNVATCDDLRAYVAACAGPFARMTCICRHGKDLLGEPCKQTSLRDNCLTIGPAAQWAVDYGIARFIGKEEMLGLLDAADKEGLVLQPENTENPCFVCCCCGCCCGVLTSAKRFPQPADYFRSNFYAEVDAEICQSCGACEARCQMDAIRSENGASQVDRGLCIGCGLCLSTCPSGALRMQTRERQNVPPRNTRALYLQLLQERYGSWGMAKLAARKMLGMKI